MIRTLENEAIERFVAFLGVQERIKLSSSEIQRVTINIIESLDGADIWIRIAKKLLLNRFVLYFIIHNRNGCAIFLKAPVFSNLAIGIRTLYRIEVAEEL